MKKIGNRPITEADTDFSRKGNQATKYKHTSKLVGKFVFAFLFHFYDTQISIHIEHEQCFHGQIRDARHGQSHYLM